MIYRVPMQEGLDLKLGLTDEVEQRIQDLYVLFSTAIGECPMYRDFGIDKSYIHMPINAMQPVFTSAIVDALDNFMPELTVVSVQFDVNQDASEIMYVEIEVSEGE